MRLKRAEKFTRAATTGLPATQQATLGQIVCGILVCRSLRLAASARGSATAVASRHNRKRVFRYADHERLSQLASKGAAIIHYRFSLSKSINAK